jgi:antitoxin (DNA-binding transcriptional repressor) of toxin-antitoxin stability system
MATTLTVTEAARNFSDVVSRAFYRRETTVLLKGGKTVAKIVPVARGSVTGRTLAQRWADLPHMDASDAEAWAAEAEATKAQLSTPHDPWA